MVEVQGHKVNEFVDAHRYLTIQARIGEVEVGERSEPIEFSIFGGTAGTQGLGVGCETEECRFKTITVHAPPTEIKYRDKMRRSIAANSLPGTTIGSILPCRKDDRRINPEERLL
uniref:Uncharacterized protein n=1 Tax=Oryza nivara TaxID=4536 RepID=A0A0E0FFS8_ORYNI